MFIPFWVLDQIIRERQRELLAAAGPRPPRQGAGMPAAGRVRPRRSWWSPRRSAP